MQNYIDEVCAIKRRIIVTSLQMIERIIIIENADPVSFYGVNNNNIALIRNLYPKLRIAARGSVIKVIGDDSETEEFEKKIHEREK